MGRLADALFPHSDIVSPAMIPQLGNENCKPQTTEKDISSSHGPNGKRIILNPPPRMISQLGPFLIHRRCDLGTPSSKAESEGILQPGCVTPSREDGGIDEGVFVGYHCIGNAGTDIVGDGNDILRYSVGDRRGEKGICKELGEDLREDGDLYGELKEGAANAVYDVHVSSWIGLLTVLGVVCGD
ncbi:hypothetical protein NHQ30_003426 [Ciborinia camelliae]|nr:hypothetical protein NHQ30_003426 [Ciborinia camelliae]